MLYREHWINETQCYYDEDGVVLFKLKWFLVIPYFHEMYGITMLAFTLEIVSLL